MLLSVSLFLSCQTGEKKFQEKFKERLDSIKKNFIPDYKCVLDGNWEHLTAYFDFPVEIRSIIYTTNAIER